MRLGHEVHLLSQDRHPRAPAFVDAVGDWDAGALRVRALRELARRARAAEPGAAPSTGRTSAACCRCTWPTATRAIEARTFAELQRRGGRALHRGNVAAVRRSRAVRPEVALANHLVMGPVILARALPASALRGEDPRQRARVHRQAPARALPRTGPRGARAGARAVLVGSRHTAESLWEALGDRSCRERTRLGPAGRGRGAVRAPASTTRRPRAGARAAPARCERAAERERRRGGPRAPSPASAPRPARRSHGSSGRGPAGGVRGQADRQQGRRPADGRLAARARAGAAGAPRGGRLRRLPGGPRTAGRGPAGAATSSEAREIARAGHGAGGRGRPAAAAALPAGLPRWPRGAGARALSRGRHARSASASCSRADSTTRSSPSCCPRAGAGRAEHLPRGVRHGRRRGRRLRGAAGQRGSLGPCGGERGAGRAPCPSGAARWLSFAVGEGAVQAIAGRLLAWLERTDRAASARRDGLVATVRERWSWESVAGGVIAAARGELRRAPRAVSRAGAGGAASARPRPFG